ncbi:MAG TPA: HAMP domain-containing sensor histidine kinase [Solirubrobacteraceae bacterium]|nr:HAMP domain-containing sensor histidine kinase [Solirubrobacteraceae bacterium]
MVSRLLPAGLRAQLALAIALITTLALGLSFVAVYRGTGSRLQDRIDTDLRTQAAEWEQLRATADLGSPAGVGSTARRFISAQRYHPASRVFIVDVAGGAPVSNQPRILERELGREHGEPADKDADTSSGHGVIDAGAGLATARVEEAGRMRVLTRAIDYHGRRVGTLQIADPLTSVDDAQDSLLRTFVLVGSLALALAVAAGVALATVIARPLRRIAAVAAAVDAGDLSLRTGATSGRGEVGVLASAFDRMLGRLESAFARQRGFVSDASHELRTPLAVLRARVELLDGEVDERRRHEATETLLRGLDEMDRLVSDMLTLASAEAGRLVEPQPIDLHDFFEDLRRDLPLFGERGFHLEAVDGVLEADPDRLTQVLRNLVRNAVTHTRVEDDVDVLAEARDGRLRISVRDGGPGIAPEHVDRIFERFYRVEESRARDSGGSGLGLAIARAIVEAHGGRIWAESQPGRGTTITLELPSYRPASRTPS